MYKRFHLSFMSGNRRQCYRKHACAFILRSDARYLLPYIFTLRCTCIFTVPAPFVQRAWCRVCHHPDLYIFSFSLWRLIYWISLSSCAPLFPSNYVLVSIGLLSAYQVRNSFDFQNTFIHNYRPTSPQLHSNQRRPLAIALGLCGAGGPPTM